MILWIARPNAVKPEENLTLASVPSSKNGPVKEILLFFMASSNGLPLFLKLTLAIDCPVTLCREEILRDGCFLPEYPWTVLLELRTINDSSFYPTGSGVQLPINDLVFGGMTDTALLISKNDFTS